MQTGLGETAKSRYTLFVWAAMLITFIARVIRHMLTRTDSIQYPMLAAVVMLWLVLAASVYLFFHNGFHLLGVGFADFPHFLKATDRFLESGWLYADNPAAYAPGKAVYKYPPLLAALLLVLKGHGWSNEAILLAAAWAQLVVYCLALVLAGIYIFQSLPRHKQKAFWSALLFIAAALQFEPFFETLYGLQLETYFLVLLLLALFCINRNHWLGAGACLALCVALKLYPAFLMIYFVVRPSAKAWAGFIAALLLLVVFSLAQVGFSSHWFYVQNLLPLFLAELPIATQENTNVITYLMAAQWIDAAQAKTILRVVVAVMVVALTFLFRRKSVVQPLPERAALEFSLWIAVLLIGMGNSWANYQLLLLIPMLVICVELTKAFSMGAAVLCAVSCILMLATENSPLNGFYRLYAPLSEALVAYRGLATWLTFFVLLYLYCRSPRLLTDTSLS